MTPRRLNVAGWAIALCAAVFGVAFLGGGTSVAPDVLAVVTFFTAAGFAAGRWKIVLLPALLGAAFFLFIVLFGESGEAGEKAFQIALASVFVPLLTVGAIGCTVAGVVLRRYSCRS